MYLHNIFNIIQLIELTKVPQLTKSTCNCICICTCIRVCTCNCMPTCILVLICTCNCIPTCTCTCTNVLYIYMYIITLVVICTCNCIFTCTRVCTILIAYLHVTCVQCMHVIIHMYICGYNVLYVYLHAHKPIVITITN